MLLLLLLLLQMTHHMLEVDDGLLELSRLILQMLDLWLQHGTHLTMRWDW